MDIKNYLDSTYLKKPEQAGLNSTENTEKVKDKSNNANHKQC